MIDGYTFPRKARWDEQEATEIIVRAGVSIDGRTIRVKAAHGARVWRVIDFLVMSHRYSVQMVCGDTVLPLPSGEVKADWYDWRK